MLVWYTLRALLVAAVASAGWVVGRRLGGTPGRRRTAVAGAASAVPLLAPLCRDWSRVPLLLAALLLLALVRGAPERTSRAASLHGLVALVGLLLAGDLLGCAWWALRPRLWANLPGPDGLLTQSTSVTCGPAAGAMLLARVGVRASEGLVAQQANCSPLSGTDFADLRRGLDSLARSHGLRARRAGLDWPARAALGRPFVIAVRLPRLGWHAVLVESVDGGRALVADPLTGSRALATQAELSLGRDQVAVWLEPVSRGTG